MANAHTTLNRVIGWEDTHEAAYFRRSVALPGETASVNLESISRTWFGQCWSVLAESDAMWRIYNPDGMSVRIETTPRKLMQSLFDCRVRRHPAYRPWASNTLFIGTVDYLNETDFRTAMEVEVQSKLATSGKDIASTFLLKRTPFSHEAEVRLLFQSETFVSEQAKEVGEAELLSLDMMKDYVISNRSEQLPQFIRLPIDWSCVDSVMTGPRVQSDARDDIERRVRALLPEVPLLRSDLYGPPVYRGTF
ncbi:hypothetical protein SAMN05660880_00307 [Luteibacter sp. 22Crub2.1]|nr:hypothetical protein SAMN05660880_00307 [Luteibacter sp. 22Crub2.1]